MRYRLINLKPVLFISLILFGSNWLGAAESDQGSNLSTLLGQVVNFVVLFGGLTYLLYKPLMGFLQHQSDRVATSLKKSEEQRLESAQKLQQLRERLKKLDEEIDIMKKEAEREATREKERIALEAKAEAERLKKLAKEEIDSLVKSSQRELEVYTLDLSISLAEKRIEERLRPELHRKLIYEAIDKLGTLDEPSVNN
ncbi:MAG: ATP synthase F0 subunit B [Acidobacteriota bacterium]|nr:ATP synthase F0 subunit B [Acidobacteriota bacterium]